ncbi:hypothetical protein Hanom_Chr16g01508701 [Helianthus anomalus]
MDSSFCMSSRKPEMRQFSNPSWGNPMTKLLSRSNSVTNASTELVCFNLNNAAWWLAYDDGPKRVSSALVNSSHVVKSLLLYRYLYQLNASPERLKAIIFKRFGGAML